MWEYGVIHLLILGFSYYSFGFCYGSAFIILFIYVADFLLDKIGYQRVVRGDWYMTFERENKALVTKYNIFSWK